MAVITISREVGSEGSYVGRSVAKALGYHLVDRDVMEEVFKQYGFVQFRDVYESAPGFWARFDEMRAQTVKLLNQAILAFAHHGQVVILGRGGFAVLGGFADVLNVRIQAPLPLRVGRVKERNGITEPGKAEALVKENDRVRVAFVESSYGVRWDAARAFDLVIDTGKVPPDAAVTWLIDAFNILNEKKVGDAHTTHTIKVDPILAKVVSGVLSQAISTDANI
jgi:cytidylate kinase